MSIAPCAAAQPGLLTGPRQSAVRIGVRSDVVPEGFIGGQSIGQAGKGAPPLSYKMRILFNALCLSFGHDIIFLGYSSFNMTTNRAIDSSVSTSADHTC